MALHQVGLVQPLRLLHQVGLAQLLRVRFLVRVFSNSSRYRRLFPYKGLGRFGAFYGILWYVGGLGYVTSEPIL